MPSLVRPAPGDRSTPIGLRILERRDSGFSPANRAPNRRIARLLGGFAAAAAIALVIGAGEALRRDAAEGRAALESATRDLLVARTRAETAERELAAARERAKVALVTLTRERGLGTLDSDPATVNMALAGDGPGARARGRISVDRARQQVTVFCSGMPDPQAGKAYQLWFIASGRPIAGGVFRPEVDGTCVFVEGVPEEARPASLFAVTLEPEQGAEMPTGEVFLVSSSARRSE